MPMNAADPISRPDAATPVVPPAISLRGVTKSFPGQGKRPGHTAVSDVNLDVGAGRFVALVGPNGCGKSTLLNLVAGLTAPSEGSIAIHGERMHGLNRRAAYMFQQDALLPWKTALDNVILGPTFAGQDRKAARALGLEWLDRIGLGAFSGHYPHQLSGGMRKRVAIAQSWISDPAIVLMDEPFSALDVQTRELTELELLRLWTASPKTVLLVTHDLAEAIALADEVVLLSAGPASRVIGVYPVELGRPRSLDTSRGDPQFAALYQRIWNDLRAEVMTGHERANRNA